MMLADTGIQKADLAKFINNCYVGGQYKTPVGKAKITEKYPYICLTSKGCWTWIEIYLAERGMYDAAIKKQIVQYYERTAYGNGGTDNSDSFGLDSGSDGIEGGDANGTT